MSTFASAARRVAAFSTLAFAVLAVVFAGGYALDDPGGWTGVGILSLVLVPALGLLWAALRHRRQALWLVHAGIGLLLGYAVAGVFGPLVDAPVLPVAAVVVAIPVAVVGLREARRAGPLMLVIGATPLLAMALERTGGRDRAFHLGGSAGAVALPLLLCAAMFLLAAVAERAGAAGGEPGTTPTGSSDRPRVAR